MPASLIQTFRAMAYHRAWAKWRLQGARAEPRQAEPEAPRRR